MQLPPEAPAARPLLTAELDYELPASRIAQRPLAQRDASRLLHVHLDGGIDDLCFRDLPGQLRPGDLLVGNDTRVRRARLRARHPDGRSVELLLLRAEADAHLCLARPARLATPGTRLDVQGQLSALVLGVSAEHPGARLVRLEAAGEEVDAAVEALGEAPLPPYIGERLDDPDRYQTVFAAGPPASAAAPTAGLHVTTAVLEQLRRRDVTWAAIRLEVGLATFAPVRGERVDDHPMHEERYSVPPQAAAAVARCRERGGRVVALGTTVVRTLEAAADGDRVRPGAGATRLLIVPGHRFRVVDGLVTNFHQPRSTLLALLAAFIGEQRWRAAYQHALDAGYRFLSFGDCMLCWRA